MASLALIIDKYIKRNGKSAIHLRITANRKAIYKSTGFEVQPKDWDKKKERVKATHANCVAINDALKAILEKAEAAHANIVSDGGAPSSHAIKERTFATHDFYVFADALVDSMTGDTQYRTQKKYKSTVNAVRLFRGNLLIEEIDTNFLKAFRKHLESEGKARNTVIARLDTFRAIYNQSPVKSKASPFEEIVIGEGRAAIIEPLTIAENTALDTYQPENKGERLALDMFLFSYYALGMRIGDVIQLKWSSILEDRVRYSQSKKEHLDADSTIEAPLNQFIDEILARWERKGPYVFNKITATDPRAIKRQVETIEATISLSLKKIALKCGITKWMSGKVARKTLADIMNKKTGRNIYMIKEAFAHSKMSTTEGYVGRDVEAIFEAAKATYGG